MGDLRKLAEAATPGPWEVLNSMRVSVAMPCEPVEDCGWDSVCVALTYPDRRFDHKANAAYIAAANPDRILALLDALELAAKHCPCGARQESLNTHPHVTGCPIGAALDAGGGAT